MPASYGLRPEVAWNLGLNLTQTFRLDYREGTFMLDYYRTEFLNQIIVDRDRNPQQVVFYNLDGQSTPIAYKHKSTMSCSSFWTYASPTGG